MKVKVTSNVHDVCERAIKINMHYMKYKYKIFLPKKSERK